MLNSNWKALIDANKVQIGTSKKRKHDENGTASSSAAAASSGEVVATPCVAIDCEFVGVGADGSENALARVSIVNFHSQVLYDKYVKPIDTVTDYRTKVSGIKPAHIHGKSAISFKQCQREVSELIGDKILVGHAVHNDLQALLLSHPKHLLRDTSKYKGLCPDRPRSLKKLVAEILKQDIQRAEHNSIEDARATLALYKHVRTKWEKELYDKLNTGRTVKHHAPAAAAAAATSSSSSSSNAAPASSASAAGSSSSAPQQPHKKQKVDPIAQKAEERKLLNQERNKMRRDKLKQQKAEKNNW